MRKYHSSAQSDSHCYCFLGALNTHVRRQEYDTYIRLIYLVRNKTVNGTSWSLDATFLLCYFAFLSLSTAQLHGCYLLAHKHVFVCRYLWCPEEKKLVWVPRLRSFQESPATRRLNARRLYGSRRKSVTSKYRNNSF